MIRFDNVAVSCTNIETSKAWYMKMFDFKPGYSTYLPDIGADFLVLKRDDLKVELISQEGSRRSETADLVPPAHVSVAYIIAIVFSIDDLEADTAALEAKGAVFVWKNLQLSDDGLKSSMLRDPDGNMVNVLQYPS
jgi:catechol 2,3-dioxygenase-like lactoylglutathione lyase family enzyme